MTSIKSKDDLITSETFSGRGWAITYHADGSISRYCSGEPSGPPLTKERAKVIRKKMAENKKKLVKSMKMRNTVASHPSITSRGGGA